MRYSAAALALSLLFTSAAFAAPKTYQVTGAVVEASDSAIIVQKGKEKWEINRTPQTKLAGNLTPGSKVTVQYTMTADSVEVKNVDKAKADKKAAHAKADGKTAHPAK